MVKKIKTIKRIKKKSVSKKFIFDDDTENYSAMSNLRNLIVLVVLIVAFFITQMGIIQPTNNKAQLMKPDLIIRKIAIEKGEILQQSLSDKAKIANWGRRHGALAISRHAWQWPNYSSAALPGKSCNTTAGKSDTSSATDITD